MSQPEPLCIRLLRFGSLALDWQPADPERFARGLQQVLDDNVVSAAEALERFQRPSSREDDPNGPVLR